VEVREQWEGDAPQVVRGPVGVRVDTVDADTQNLGVGGLKTRNRLFDRRYFLTSSGSPVDRIEQKHYMVFVAEPLAAYFASELIFQHK